MGQLIKRFERRYVQHLNPINLITGTASLSAETNSQITPVMTELLRIAREACNNSLRSSSISNLLSRRNLLVPLVYFSNRCLVVRICALASYKIVKIGWIYTSRKMYSSADFNIKQFVKWGFHKLLNFSFVPSKGLASLLIYCHLPRSFREKR